MKTKSQLLLTLGLLLTLLYSCSSGIKPDGKYSVGTPDNINKYIFEFKDDGIVNISFNNEREFNNVFMGFQRKNDLLGNLWNIVRGNPSLDPQFIKYLTDNRKEVISLMSNNNQNKNSFEQLTKIKNLQIDFNYLFEFSKINPELMSNDNFVQLVNEYKNSENQVNIAFSELASLMCTASGKWDTNYGGDIIISDITNKDCKTLPDFNGEYKTCKEPDCVIGLGNYSKNELLMKPINN
jgi:hypothetical protein